MRGCSSKRKRRSIASGIFGGRRIRSRRRSRTSRAESSRSHVDHPDLTVSDEYIVPHRHKVIEEEPLHPKEPSVDEDLRQKQRELQQAAINEYNVTRTIPTIQDPKIYSVRVRVGTCASCLCSAAPRCWQCCR